MFVLNVLSPIEHVFWNTAEYRAFRDGAHACMQPLVRKESTPGIVDNLIRDTGAGLKSELASELLGGLTGFFGDRYHPKHREQPSFLSAGRHTSIGVPASCRLLVSRYFHELGRVFGESSSRPCSEETSLYYGSDSDSTLAGLLCDNILLMSEEQRHALLARIRSGVDVLAIENPEHFAFTGNAIGISTAGIEVNSAALDDFSEIVRFRVDTAIRHYSLLGVEKLLKYDLANKNWGLLCLADLRDELRGRLNAVLARYPVIETNPFEQAAL